MIAAYATPLERVWYYAFRIICGLVLVFLMLPILVIAPLSFNADSFISTRCPASRCNGTRSSSPRQPGGKPS